MSAHNGARFVTPSGTTLDGAKDLVKAPPTSTVTEYLNEVPASLVDHMEFYLLNYFKPATYEQTEFTMRGRELFE